ncbi:MAG TPA: hypothetical protein EYQ20_03905 [candidate division Zixibacteria bacterium]|nr:hypothetical protein [candidate division Zixibacteria bacterium]
MKRFVNPFIDVRRGEFSLVFLMFSYYYLVLVTNYFLKPTRDSLFLVRLGADQLPLTFILIAVVVLPITTSYARFSRSLPLTRLINITTAVFVGNLLILRGLIGLDQTWVYYLFYVWVSIYGVLSTSQFWLFANTVFSAPQAKRLFPILNVGGILGAVTGGEVTSLIVSSAGIAPENLLFFCMGFLTTCIILMNVMWSMKAKESGARSSPASAKEGRRESLKHMAGTVRQSRSLRFIVGMIVLMVIVTAIVDFQFKSISVETYQDKADLTSFLGKFYGRIGLIALLIQIFLSSRLIRVLGVGGAILFLPVSLMLGSIALFIVPGLWTAVALRGTDQSFRYSLNKTGLELLYIPVPQELKNRTKVFIDVFIDQVAQGFTGVLLLVFTLVLGLSVRSLSLVAVVLAGAWIFLAVRAYVEYIDAFRKALERRDIDLGNLRTNIRDAASVETLITTLQSPNERQVIYALDMLMSVAVDAVGPAVQPLLTHDTAEIRRKALQVLRATAQAVPLDELNPLLEDTDPDVRLAAMSVICLQDPDPASLLKTYLSDPDLKIRSAAVVCIAHQDDPDVRLLINIEVVETLLVDEENEGEVLRMQVARALGMLNEPSFRPILLQLIRDPSILVARSAIESAGVTRDPEFVPPLIDLLAAGTFRAVALQALAAYGAQVQGELQKTLLEETGDIVIKQNIPRVLRQIANQVSIDILQEALDQVQPALQYPIIKALNRLHQDPSLHIDEKRIHTSLIHEAQTYYEMQTIRQLSWVVSPSTQLLIRSLSDKQHRSLELMFRLLGLLYAPQDIQNAYEGITSRDASLRASAVEFLDNLLHHTISRYLFPVLDQISVEDTIDKGRELFGYRLESTDQALSHLIQGHDIWLKTCAIAAITGNEPDSVLIAIRQAMHTGAPLVRETAAMMLDRLAHAGTHGL